MKTTISRIENLIENLAALLEKEQGAYEQALSELVEFAQQIRGDTADRRLQRLTMQLKSLQDRLKLLTQMARHDFLAKVKTETEEMKRNLKDSRIARVLSALIEISPTTDGLNHFCETLLDHLIASTGAERGFVLFYLPETTEAEVIAARDFETKNLALEEYDFSRTLLQEVFRRGKPLLFEDVLHHPNYAKEISVRKFRIRSVLVVPFLQDNRKVGALYLEDNSHPAVFDEEDLQFVQDVTRFAVFCLHHARLLPVILAPDRTVVFDATKAAKDIVGRHHKIQTLQQLIQQVADSPATVLISGESGTGKELVARALHYNSSRRKHPFIVINCAAIPENLLESQLFGHEKGAFTGATERYIGRIEQGNGGTIFLDEISELPFTMQAKLLRFLQSNEFERLGAKETIHVEVRVVAATSKDLKTLVQEGKLQEALYYRLNVIPIHLPPLRERKEDIPLLIDHFLQKYGTIYGKSLQIEQEVYECLKMYEFPGNVRELENLIHRLVALASNTTVHLSDLPRDVLSITPQRVSLAKDPLQRILHSFPADLDDLRSRKKEIERLLAEQERQFLERAVQAANGNITRAASKLGVHRVTLHKMLKRVRKK